MIGKKFEGPIRGVSSRSKLFGYSPELDSRIRGNDRLNVGTGGRTDWVAGLFSFETEIWSGLVPFIA